MNEAMLRSLEAEIRARTGIDLGGNGRSDLHRAVAAALAARGQGDGADALAELVRDGRVSSLVAELVSAVTINETHFWRVPRQLEALRAEVFPRLAVARSRPVRVWSAACSTGPEPYSVAMAADAAAVLTQPGIEIDATDVDVDALQLARQARYGKWAMRGVDADMQRRWFTEEPDGSFRPVARIRGVVNFSTHSVIDPSPTEPYDIVLCRNLLIYFDDATRSRTISNMFDALVPGGILLVAPAEMQAQLFAQFEPVTFASGALGYRRPGGGRRSPVAPRHTSIAPRPAPLRRAAPADRTPSTPPVDRPSVATTWPPAGRSPAPASPPREPAAGSGPTSPSEPATASEEDVALRLRHGLVLLEQGEGHAAVQVLRESAVLAPASADAQAALALALLHVQSFRRAAAAAKRALELLGSDHGDTEAGRHATVVLGTLAALEDVR